MQTPTTALCVGRHRFLSDHLGLYFEGIGLRTVSVVGLDEARAALAAAMPDVVLCDYDLLATIPAEHWERGSVFGMVPLIAVSLTRRPEEMHVLDVNGIGGFLYLPTLDPKAALGLIEMTRRAVDYSPARGFPRTMTAPSAS